jgi:hypothetical protein
VKTLVALAAAVALMATAASAGGTLTKPSLRLLDRNPVVVRGTGFAARERVVVSAFSPGRTVVRRLVASTSGTFTTRFDLVYGSCTGVRAIRAVGARSGVATIRVLPTTRECPPPAP